MNQSLYRGDCQSCNKHIRAGLSLSVEGTIPPPVIVVGCGCTISPTETHLVYYGCHSSEAGHTGRDVHWADKPSPS